MIVTIIRHSTIFSVKNAGSVLRNTIQVEHVFTLYRNQESIRISL